jgi:hypothetical protein
MFDLEFYWTIRCRLSLDVLDVFTLLDKVRMSKLEEIYICTVDLVKKSN